MRTLMPFAACLTLLLAGCAGKGPVVPDVPAAGSPAAQLFVNRCGVCHAAPHPARYDYAAWCYLVPVMEQHMKERGMGMLSADERDTILAYLQEYAR